MIIVNRLHEAIYCSDLWRIVILLRIIALVRIRVRILPVLLLVNLLHVHLLPVLIIKARFTHSRLFWCCLNYFLSLIISFRCLWFWRRRLYWLRFFVRFERFFSCDFNVLDLLKLLQLLLK